MLGLYNELQKEGKELYHAYSTKSAKVKDLTVHVRSLEDRLLAEVRHLVFFLSFFPAFS